MTNDDDVNDLLWNVYDYKKIDKEDIQKRLDLMIPSNMWVIF
jgi:hypothetical protein